MMTRTARLSSLCTALAVLALAPAVAHAAPPDTTIDSGPGPFTNDTTPTFDFASSAQGATFECRLDDAAGFSACDDPHTTAELNEGEHTLHVRAGFGGETDETPASATFTVDISGPDTTVVSGPEGVTTNPFPVFEFGSNEPGPTFFCRLQITDIFRACGSPLSTPRLADGGYQLEVVAVDRAGNVDPTPATREFTVDTIPNLAVLSRRVRYRRGEVRVRLRCAEVPALGPCVGRLALRRTNGTVLGSLRFSLAAGEARTVTVRIKPARRRALVRFEVLTVDAQALLFGTGGRFDTVIEPLVLRTR